MSFLTNYLDLGSEQSNANVVTVADTVEISDIANLKIAGGSAGDVIQTDGAGNLYWTASANSTQPTGPANAVQYNFGGVFTGDTGFTFDSNTLNTENAVLGNVVTTQANITGQLNIQGGQQGQYLATNGAGSLIWSFNGSGVGYPTDFTRLNTRVAGDTLSGVSDIDVTPAISVPANTIVSFGGTLNLYKILSSSTVGSITTFSLERPLAEPVLVNTIVDEVTITPITDIEFGGVIDSDYPPPSADTSIGNVKTAGSKLFLEQDLHPNATATGTGIIYNNNGTYYSDTISVDDSTGALTAPVITVPQITDIDSQLVLSGAGQKIRAISSNLNINPTVNGSGTGNLKFNSNLTVNGPLYTPNDTSVVNYNSSYVSYYNPNNFSLDQNQIWILSGWNQLSSTNIPGLVNSSGKFYNYSGAPMTLSITFTLSATVLVIANDDGTRNFWLTVDGDYVNKRYGYIATNTTGWAYKIGNFNNGGNYFGPTAFTSSSILVLPNNSRFEINFYQNATPTSEGLPNANAPVKINWPDPTIPENPGTTTTYNTNLGQTRSSFLYVTRLD